MSPNGVIAFMDLKTYLSGLGQEDRDAVAAAAGTTYGHMRNVSYGLRPCSPELASGLEQATKAAVMRWDMRPDDWHRIWPELRKRKDAPAIPIKTAA